MPKFLEDRLKAEAASKGLTGRQADRYTFGAMNNRGLMRGNVETPKGAALQAKHERDVKAGTAAPAPTLSPTPTRAAGPMAHASVHPGRNLGPKWLHPKKG